MRKPQFQTLGGEHLSRTFGALHMNEPALPGFCDNWGNYGNCEFKFKRGAGAKNLKPLTCNCSFGPALYQYRFRAMVDVV
jgi:hypothetical protein